MFGWGFHIDRCTQLVAIYVPLLLESSVGRYLHTPTFLFVIHPLDPSNRCWQGGDDNGDVMGTRVNDLIICNSNKFAVQFGSGCSGHTSTRELNVGRRWGG